MLFPDRNAPDVLGLSVVVIVVGLALELVLVPELVLGLVLGLVLEFTGIVVVKVVEGGRVEEARVVGGGEGETGQRVFKEQSTLP